MNQETRSIGLLGAGAQASEMIDYAKELGISVDFQAVNPQYLDSKNAVKTIDISAPSGVDLEKPVIIAVGPPQLRQNLKEQWQGKNYATLVAKAAWVSQGAEILSGSMVAPKSAIATFAKIGRHVLVNLGVTISHEAVIGDFTNISPGVHIGGRVEIGQGVFVGIGAAIKNDVKIANGVVIGAGTVVINDVDEENAVVVGCPGKVIKVNPGWLDDL